MICHVKPVEKAKKGLRLHGKGLTEEEDATRRQLDEDAHSW